MMVNIYSTINATTGLLFHWNQKRQITTGTGLFRRIERTTHLEPHPGLVIASHYFNETYHPIIGEIELLSLATMDLLNMYAYPSLSGYAKFTLSFTIKESYGEDITFTLGPAISLTDSFGKLIPKNQVYTEILRNIEKYAEKYEGVSIVQLMIRVYMESKKKAEDRPAALSEEERSNTLDSIISGGLSEIESPITARKIQHGKHRSYPTHITTLKQRRTKRKAFIVADIETIMVNEVHVPYAAGYLVVTPDEDLTSIPSSRIQTFFSEDYPLSLDIFNTFPKRSTKVLSDFVLKILSIVKNNNSTIYFHNLSRFDGIILLKHLALHHKSLKHKALIRNNKIYEIAVYSGNKLKFRFRDSLHLLPGTLNSLANNLCPELGSKGSIPYNEVREDNLSEWKTQLLDYMIQDIRLLGGVMQKAQQIYWDLFKVDIESKITLSALALSIFRGIYYDVSHFPIHIPNKNEDTFIRRAYYGGHVDVYKPYGENLYYYDVNSLYPFVMKSFEMPGGEPVWHSHLDGMELDSMCGFIEAYVECPKTIKKPFLPYRDMKKNTLIFPTGEFVGVYYTEELKYARGLGYKVLPISGYLFKKMETPFSSFVSELFESRLDAKKKGNEAIAYVYKILMNSLYGRFGINPKSTTTEICDGNRHNDLMRLCNFISSHPISEYSDNISENKYVVSYHSNTDKGPDYWNPPKNSAVQLSAAITACARIHMYPYISREDCYYTDTDSVVLGHPLPNEEISSSVLGKLKLEDIIEEGHFLAPKTYAYKTPEGKEVSKYKGPAKKLITKEWFEEQYKDPSRTQEVLITNHFRTEISALEIRKKISKATLQLKLGRKRIPVYDRDLWVDTDPIHILDLSSVNHIGIKIIENKKQELRKQQIEIKTLNEKLKEKGSEIKSQLEEKAITEPPILTEGKKGLEVREDSQPIGSSSVCDRVCSSTDDSKKERPP